MKVMSNQNYSKCIEQKTYVFGNVATVSSDYFYVVNFTGSCGMELLHPRTFADVSGKQSHGDSSEVTSPESPST